MERSLKKNRRKARSILRTDENLETTTEELVTTTTEMPQLMDTIGAETSSKAPVTYPMSQQDISSITFTTAIPYYQDYFSDFKPSKVDSYYYNSNNVNGFIPVFKLK